MLTEDKRSRFPKSAFVRRLRTLIDGLVVQREHYRQLAATTPDGPARRRFLEREEWLDQVAYELGRVIESTMYWR